MADIYSDPILCPQIASSPAEVLLHEAALQGVADGWWSPFRGWDCEALMIELDGVAVSAMALQTDPAERAIIIILGSTHPDHRRRGLYRRLWERLVELARERERDVLEIRGYRAVGNEASAAMARALGREDFTIGSRIVLEDVPEGA